MYKLWKAKYRIKNEVLKYPEKQNIYMDKEDRSKLKKKHQQFLGLFIANFRENFSNGKSNPNQLRI